MDSDFEGGPQLNLLSRQRSKASLTGGKSFRSIVYTFLKGGQVNSCPCQTASVMVTGTVLAGLELE